VERPLSSLNRDDKVASIQPAGRNISSQEIKPLAGVEENHDPSGFGQCRAAEQSALKLVWVKLERRKESNVGRITIEE